MHRYTFIVRQIETVLINYIQLTNEWLETMKETRQLTRSIYSHIFTLYRIAICDLPCDQNKVSLTLFFASVNHAEVLFNFRK